MLVCFGNEYFITYKNLTRDRFIESSGVKKDSWAEDLMQRIYDCLLGNVTNVIEEYKKFYQVEYSTLDEFLRKRYGLNESELQTVKDSLPQNYILAHGYFDSESDYNIVQLMEYSSEVVESIKKILVMGENR